ncbi:MAG: alpha-2-macroglobulin family protein, partial [Chloroflexota bacterium]
GWDAYSFYNWDVLWQQFQQVQLQLQNSSQPKSDLGIRVGHGAGSSGARGNLPISLPIDLTKLKLDQTITLESTTTDTSNQSVSSRATINAYRSALAIGLAAEKDVVPAGQQVSVQVAAVQHDGKPFAGASLIATIAKRTYTSKLVPGVNGSAAWRAVPHDTVIDTQTLAPDASGKASVSFTPADGGDYVVTVSGKDSAGNHTSNEVSIYASAAGFSDFGATNDTSLTLKPDKSTYAVGDTAHVLVAAPFASENALITVERGNIRKHWVQRLTSNSSTVDVPVTIDDLPNVYVTVTLYRGAQGSAPPDWRYGAVELHVQVAPRHLIIHVAQTGSRHHPRDRVTYTVKTTDAHGRPVSAQLSLALVDSAVLALQPETNADILQAYYAEQPLAVSTTSDAILSIDHLQVTPDFRISPSGAAIKAQHGAASYDAAVPAPVLAGGGGGGGEPPPAITVRSHFADTAYWSGALTTNAAGRASITLALPDNATTWRLDVRGVTGNQAVGQAHLSTLATQDIVLRPVTPRFLEQGGSLKLGAVLNNTLSHAITARVTLSASGISIGLAPPRLVTVPAKGQRLMLWPARVGIVKSAQVLLRAVPTSTNVRGDAVRIRLPVYKPLTDETVATAGQVYGSTRQLVMVPLHAATSPGALTVQVSASITAGLGAAFGQFQPRQNESNDDVANRVLAAASLRHLPASITGLRASTYRRLPQIVAAGVQKLMDDQYGDGGWPWFNGPYEFSDFQVSLDVLQALAASGEHGPLVRQSIARGRQYLKGQQNLSTADRAQSLLVLAQTGGYPRFRAELLYGSSPQQLHLSPAPLGDLGLALADVKDRSHARSIVAALDGKAVVSATGAHWEGNAWDPWSQPAIEETARVLATLVALSPHDPFVPAAARWLMLARQGAGWDSPHDSAQAIAALALYGRAAREGHAAYSYRVAVNGHARLSGNYAGSRQTGVGNARVPVAQLRRNHVSTIDIGRHANGGSFGTGPLYYVTRLKYYLPANRISPRNEGLSVSRRYLNLAGKPINHVAAGSPMQVQLTVHTSQTLLHLDIEDPIPVGCEPIDPSLATSQQGLFRPPVFYPQGRTLNLAWYLIHSDLRDNRVSLYSYSLPPGTYRYTYLAQATVPRSYGVPPTHAAETFFPEVFGRSAGQEFTVTR